LPETLASKSGENIYKFALTFAATLGLILIVVGVRDLRGKETPRPRWRSAARR